MLMRSAFADARDRPVENLATNPSFERAVPGLTIIRRNLHPAPHGALYMAPNAGGSTRSLETADGPEGRPWVKYVFTQAPTGSPLSIVTGATLAQHAAVRPGTVVTMSADVFSDYGGYSQLRIDGNWLDSAGNTVASFSGTDAPTAPIASRWLRISNTRVVPAGAAYLRMFVALSSPQQMPVGTIVGIAGLMVEERSTTLPFIAGDTPNTRGITYAFEGAANASPSVARAGVVEVRRNHAIAPRPIIPNGTSWTTRWYGGGGGSGNTTVEQNGFEGRSFIRKTWTASPASPEDTGIVARTDVVPGKTYTVLMRVRASKDMSFRGNADSPAGLVVQVATAANGSYNTVVPGSTVAAHRWRSNGNWVWARSTFTVPEGAVSAQAFCYVDGSVTNPTWNPGDYLDAMDAVFVEGVYAGEFFDGFTTPDADLTPAWTGAEGASPSVLYALQPVQTDSANSQNAFAIYQWNGGVRVSPNKDTSNDSALRLGGDIGGLRMGMQAGRTYTVLATLTVPAALGLPNHSNALSIVAFFRPSGVPYQQAKATAPNAPGKYPLRLTFTIPADAAEAFVRLYNGTQAGRGDVIWDELAVVEGAYTGPYIDGDMPGCIWRGTPHDSRSVGYAKAA